MADTQSLRRIGYGLGTVTLAVVLAAVVVVVDVARSDRIAAAVTVAAVGATDVK